MDSKSNFAHIGSFTCECGKVFDNSQSFNGHKSHCLIHQKIKYNGDLTKIAEAEQTRHTKMQATMTEKAAQAKGKALTQWIAEQHTCEHCGKVMTEKYGSGRFCCEACANAREVSDITRQKIAAALKGKPGVYYKSTKTVVKYKQPKYCVDCGKLLIDRGKSLRCLECFNIHRHNALSASSKASAARHGGNNNQYGVRGRCHYGTYKGFHLDSSYELAFVVYCLENNINLERNHKGFNYIYDDEEHLYYPDFIINNTYIEIKNYWTDRVQAKIDYFPKELNYKIIYKQDMQKYISYCENKYGKEYWNILYE